ncbi:MAG: YidC/Oxa1 family membrane protein insertase [Nibricoccus sp.]
MHSYLTALLSYLVQTFGGNLGWAILALSLGIRVALLPLTLRLSRRMLRNQQIALALRPEIEEIKKRFEKKPERIFGEMQKVYKKHGYSPFDLPAMLGSFVQLPIFGVMYRVIKDAVSNGGPFLWIRSLASPDGWLTLAILTLTGASAYFMPAASASAKSTLIFIQVAITGFIVWKLAAGLGLYWAASSLVGLGQNLWLRSRIQQETALAYAK